ncbi:MAG: Transposase IS200 like protein [Syntrophorhabdus sp. PtaU1.Bin153]|nr:MAG: Transposase IS200 like protein [Syntrophorhabdus sp. PtaU1.Bin153]
MARQPRLDAPGILHHVIVRGIERKKIFWDDADRKDFLDRCGMIFPETKTACYAFALIPNHVHLLVRTGTTPLSTTMARVLTGYAVHFNRTHRRYGQLFQNRYKSIVCQEDVYLKELVRYIHLNPLRAGILKDIDALASFPYAGHAALMGTMPYPWQDEQFVLSLFGDDALQARMAYLDFVKEGLAQGRRSDLAGGGLVRSHRGWTEIRKSSERLKGDVRILGNTRFVLDTLSRAQQKLDNRYHLRRMGVDLSFVEQRVLKLCNLSKEELYSRGRQKRSAEAKALLCFFAVRELGLTQTRLAERLRMTQPGVASAVARGERLARDRGYVLLDEGNRD